MELYKITNKFNGKAYIGQTMGSVRVRWKDHCTKRNTAIGAAIQKYGRKNFTFEVLAEYQNLLQLNHAEEFFIDHFCTLSPYGYNLHTGGSNHQCSAETKAKLSEARRRRPPASEDTRSKLSRAQTGRSVTWGDKIANTLRGRRRSEETLRRMSASLTGRAGTGKRGVVCETTGVKYESLTQAAAAEGVRLSRVSECVNGKRAQTKGKVFRYLLDAGKGT